MRAKSIKLGLPPMTAFQIGPSIRRGITVAESGGDRAAILADFGGV